MRIGYSFWGFLGDYKYDRFGNKTSAPDGNASYSWSIVASAIQRGHEVLPMQQNRDVHGFSKHKLDLFKSFSQLKRYATYAHLCNMGAKYRSYESFPELDVLLLEWRFPIPGRNTEDDVDKPGFQPDLMRQWELIEHYSRTKTKIIYWDLDGKMNDVNSREAAYRPDAVFETAAVPATKLWADDKIWHQVQPPFLTSDFMQHSTCEVNNTKKLVYIGSRYERDDIIDEWMKPVSERFLGEVQFFGKWDDDAKARWPMIKYIDRVTMADFREIYSDAVCVPLLAKRDYMNRGFITPRPWEALLFGSLPVGLMGHQYVHDYVTRFAEDIEDLCLQLRLIKSQHERHIEREELAHKLHFIDAKFFVEKIENVVR